MPELPEVEHVRRQLARRIQGAVLVSLTIHRSDVVRHGGRRGPAAARDLAAALRGARIERLDRRGKQLALVTADAALVIQLGMSGRVRLVAGVDPPPEPHLHAVLRFEASGERIALGFVDPRRFGGLTLVRPISLLETGRWSRLGPDALSIGEPDLAGILAASRRPVKALLLDQARIAGIGNIYADEALHRAAIHPRRPAASLRPLEVAALAAAIRGVLGEAVAFGGSTIRDYRGSDGELGGYADRHLVYGRGGAPCRGCGALLCSDSVGGRTTTWCRRCQPRRGQRAT